MRLCSVAVVVFNSPNEVRQCLESVLRGSTPDKTELLIWDNHSDPPTQEVLDDIEKQCKDLGFKCGIVRGDSNQGFGQPVNKLSVYATGDYFTLLNSDAVVPDGWLEMLRQPFLDEPMVGATAPEGGCRTLTEQGDGFRGDITEYLEGSCLMVPTNLFRRLGGFRTELFPFAYAEDSDLGLRLNRAGYVLREVPMPGYAHARATTATAVQSTVDLNGQRLVNNASLVSVWSDYITAGKPESHKPETRRVPHYINGVLQNQGEIDPVEEPRSFERELILKRSGALGDCLWLSALARSLHDIRPRWKLRADTPYSALFDANPLIGAGQPGLVPGDVIDLDGSYEAFPEGHFIEHYARAVGVDGAPLRLPEIYLRPVEKEAARSRRCEVMEASGNTSDLVVMHAGPTTWPGKNILPEVMDEVSRQLVAQGYNVAAVGGTGGHRPAAAHDFMGLGLRESAGVIGVADYFIGLDSFPATCAYAFRVPSVVAFGAVPPERVIVEKFFVEPVSDGWLRCIGCHAKQVHPRTWSGCLREPVERRWAPCMRNIKPMHILDALDVVKDRTQAMITEWLKDELYWRPLIPRTGKGIDLACGRRAIGGEAFDRFPLFHVDNTGDIKKRLPYPDGEFDWVFSGHSLEDLEVPDWTMGEIRRVLKPGGQLIVSVPSDEHYVGYNEDHCRLFTMDALVDLLVRNGFTVTKRGTDIDTDRERDYRYSLMAVGEKDA